MSTVRRIRLLRSPRIAEPTPVPPLVDILIQREADGTWFVGLHDDAAGPFETMQLAAAVAQTQGGRTRKTGDVQF